MQSLKNKEQARQQQRKKWETEKTYRQEVGRVGAADPTQRFFLKKGGLRALQGLGLAALGPCVPSIVGSRCPLSQATRESWPSWNSMRS